MIPTDLDTDTCGHRDPDLYRATRAVCILEPDHVSPQHWGPDREGRYVTWN